MHDTQQINDDLKAWHERIISQLDLVHEHADKKMDIGKDITFKFTTSEEIKAFRIAIMVAKSIIKNPPKFIDDEDDE